MIQTIYATDVYKPTTHHDDVVLYNMDGTGCVVCTAGVNPRDPPAHGMTTTHTYMPGGGGSPANMILRRLDVEMFYRARGGGTTRLPTYSSV